MIEQREMLEAFGIPDTFVTGLGSVEDIGGGCWRFTFFTAQGRDLIVAAKLVICGEALPDAIHMAAKLTNNCACERQRGLLRN
jgi:hypothetical protein